MWIFLTLSDSTPIEIEPDRDPNLLMVGLDLHRSVTGYVRELGRGTYLTLEGAGHLARLLPRGPGGPSSSGLGDVCWAWETHIRETSASQTRKNLSVALTLHHQEETGRWWLTLASPMGPSITLSLPNTFERVESGRAPRRTSFERLLGED